MSYQKYYVPEESKFPIYAATALFSIGDGRRRHNQRSWKA